MNTKKLIALTALFACSALSQTAGAGEKKNLLQTLKPKYTKLEAQTGLGASQTVSSGAILLYTDYKQASLVKHSTKQLEAFQSRLLSASADIHPVATFGTEAELIGLNHQLTHLRMIPEKEQSFLHAVEIGATEDKIAELKKLINAQQKLIKVKGELTDLQVLHAAITNKQQVEKLAERTLSGRSKLPFHFLEKNTKEYKKLGRIGFVASVIAIDGVARIGAATLADKDVGITAFDDIGMGIYDAVKKRINPRTPANLPVATDGLVCGQNASCDDQSSTK